MNDFSNLHSIIYQMTEILKTDPNHGYWAHTFKNLFNNPDLHNRPDDFKKQVLVLYEKPHSLNDLTMQECVNFENLKQKLYEACAGESSYKFTILFERDSICAADDVWAPNTFTFHTNASEPFAAALNADLIKSYLPSSTGARRFWKASYNNQVLAKICKSDEWDDTTRIEIRIKSLLDTNKLYEQPTPPTIYFNRVNEEHIPYKSLHYKKAENMVHQLQNSVSHIISKLASILK